MNNEFVTMVQQYEQTAETLRIRIGELTQQRRIFPDDSTNPKANQLDERIKLLDVERRQLLNTAHYIRQNYVDNPSATNRAHIA